MNAPPSALEIRGLRLALRLTQTEYAALLGVRLRTIQEWETGSGHPKLYLRWALNWLAVQNKHGTITLTVDKLPTVSYSPSTL